MSEITGEHIDALRAVDLRVCFATHGMSTSLRDQGPMVLGGVGMREYRGMDGFVAGLDAARGDVMAREGRGYADQLTPHLMLELAIDRAEQSPYIDRAHFDGLVVSEPNSETVAIPSDGGDEPMHFSIPKMSALFDAAVALRVTNPFEYGAVRAALRGIPCKVADASRADGFGSLDPRRDFCIVRDLGEHAMAMRPVGDERPRLGYSVGLNHKRALQEILGTRDVPFTSVDINTTPLTHVQRKLEMGSLLVGVLTQRIDSIEQIWVKKWVKNARKQTANGLL